MTILSNLEKSYKNQKPPIWLMRQAGRYLPEYRDLRSKTGSFLDLCYNPDLAYEVSMQPIRRFDFDAAILFSDILVIPHALGFDLNFNNSIQLEAVTVEKIPYLREFNLDKFLNHLSASFETIRKLRQNLPISKSVIGFCGAPWTVATYMIAGKTSKDQIEARIFAIQHREEFLTLLDILVDFSIHYLSEQIKAGADIIQIFDSWASILSKRDFEDFCLKPIQKIVANLKQKFPNVKIIAFPKGANNFLFDFVEKTNIDILSVDWSSSFSDLKILQQKVAIQGNLDPLILAYGEKTLKSHVFEILENLSGGSFIFNLGHGIIPETPVENVINLLKYMKQYYE